MGNTARNKLKKHRLILFYSHLFVSLLQIFLLPLRSTGYRLYDKTRTTETEINGRSKTAYILCLHSSLRFRFYTRIQAEIRLQRLLHTHKARTQDLLRSRIFYKL